MLINPAKFVYKTISSTGCLTSVKIANEKVNYEDNIFSFLVRSVQEYSRLKVDSYFPSDIAERVNYASARENRYTRGRWHGESTLREAWLTRVMVVLGFECHVYIDRSNL